MTMFCRDFAMTLTPILEAAAIIQFHVLAAVPSLVLGPVIIWGRASRVMHRRLGYTWVASMVLLAVSGLFIPSQGLALVGHMGPIHLLCFLTLAGLAQGIWYARMGQIGLHRAVMRSVWLWALGVAGMVTLLPGRIMHETLLAGRAEAGWLVIAAGLCLLALVSRRQARPLRQEDFPA
jgi:uncharacterized membrane protein